MSFLIYDIVFLVVFSLILIIFLYKKRKNLKRQGILFLYPTKIGINFINYIGNKFKKSLNVISYFVILIGYILMVISIYALFYIVYIFLKIPEVRKIPPLMPLVPYLPEILKIEFLPPFYFTYWILAIAIVAISHEFSHGIFASYKKIKIKSTGFGFLGPFLAAFVEPDEKNMEKKSKFVQLSVLSAGSFANIIMTIIFFLIMWLFFSFSFVEGGAIFNTYTYSEINLTDIKKIDNITIEKNTDIIEILNKENILVKSIKFNNEELNLTSIYANNKTYYAEISLFKNQIVKNSSVVFAFDDLPAINVGLKGAIIEFNGIKIKNGDDLGKEVSKYGPGDNVTIKTEIDDKELNYNIILAENPTNKSKAYLGIGVFQNKGDGILRKLIGLFKFFNIGDTYYKPLFNKNLAFFIYNLLWWILLINFSVAILNMLPVGIFDGGRVFFLTMFALTKSKKKAMKIFKALTYLILLIVLFLMILWLFSF